MLIYFKLMRYPGRGSNGGLCLRRLGLELAAGGVKRPFAHWRAVAAPDVEPENSGSNSSRHRKTTKRKTQCCQSLRQLLTCESVREAEDFVEDGRHGPSAGERWQP